MQVIDGEEVAETPEEVRKKSVSSIPMELLAAALCMAVLAALAVTLLSDGKARFDFNLEPRPSPAATTEPAPAAASESAPGAIDVEGVTGGIQSLFVEEQSGRAASRSDESLFVPDPDFVDMPRYRNLRESELGQMYSANVKIDKRALDRVVRVGGFRSAEAMASAFGYVSVDEMISVWDQRTLMGTQLPISEFGTNATPVVPDFPAIPGR